MADHEQEYLRLSRRTFLKRCVVAGGTLVLGRFVTGCATAPTTWTPRRGLVQESGDQIDLTIAKHRIYVGGRETLATTVNGGIPGPEIRLQEGQIARLNVTNTMDEDTSIHWHGILLPPGMDGVPGVSFDGIRPGETFNYRYKVRQAGTYWYHSHSSLQEQTGIFGPLVIDPIEPPPYTYDREYTIVLSDWTFENPHRILARLKKYEGYYNFQRRTLANLPQEARNKGGLGKALKSRLQWGGMRMDPTDLSDVTGATYTYLMNGMTPNENWRGRFESGERIRLRIINASAATYFDVRIPGLPMTVVQADGIDVEPVEVDEFRIAIAETYDVLIEPKDEPYTIFAETTDRSGFARGTLALDESSTAPTPELRERPLLGMDAMGMDEMDGMEGMDNAPDTHDMHSAHAHAAAENGWSCESALDVVAHHGPDKHGPTNAMVAHVARSRVDDPGVGLRDAPHRVLTYSDLRRLHAAESALKPDREIELHLTGHMGRYIWSFDGKPYRSDMPPITLQYGERVRFILINDTMMAHPIHLHGMFFELEVGACEKNPLKHTVNVNPAERTSFLVTAKEVGKWAFHCHILYHMEMGMFRVVEIVP